VGFYLSLHEEEKAMTVLRERKMAVVDRDWYACFAFRNLMTRDPRVRAGKTWGSFADLLAWLPSSTPWEQPELLFLSLDGSDMQTDLPGVLAVLEKMSPNLLVICMATTASSGLVELVLHCGAAGLFIKPEISRGLIPGGLRARQGKFICTPGVYQMVCAAGELARRKSGQFPRPALEVVPAWRPVSLLDSRMQEAFELRYVFGHSARETGRQLGVKDDTVNTYVSKAYEAVINRVDAAREDMELIEETCLAREQKAVVAYTALPASCHNQAKTV